MGQLVPEDFDLGTLRNDAERQVVETLRDGLTDGWFVMPHVPIRTRKRDYEIDVVIVHRDFGVAVVEVKGNRVAIRNGTWYGPRWPMEPQPTQQATSNAYALRDVLRSAHPALAHLPVEWSVALPNTRELVGDLPPEVDREQVLTAAELQDPIDAIETLMLSRTRNRAIDDDRVEVIVRTIRPDVDFSHDPTARMSRARTRLDELCRVQTHALESLDVNRRVVAVGGAGTGKTRLATAWARRAWTREERVLFTCYNDPLAEVLADRLPDDEHLVVGSFFPLARSFAGMPPLEVPPDADHEWWMVTAAGHLAAHWHEVEERFDTIVIDEAQDFRPGWLAMLESLLRPDGPRRMLMVTDPAQVLHDRGFRVPAPDDGWTVCELVTNCRNSQQIARILRTKLDGAASPMSGPEAVDVRHVSVPVGNTDAVVTAVGSELNRLIDDEERDPTSVAVLSFRSVVRDALRDAAGLDLVRWEERAEGVLGENVHRVKGLEHDTVILVSDRSEEPDDLLYVGVSRAVSELIVISPEAVASRLGLRRS